MPSPEPAIDVRGITKRFGHRTVVQSIDLQVARGEIHGFLDRLGLGPRRRQLAGVLSGGWKQRLALAACLIHQPQLLLLDEPTAGVDPKARREFWEEIHRLAGGGLTVLITTHYMDEAERCHRLAYLAYGRLLACGTVGEVIAAAGLHTWKIAGPALPNLADGLRGQPAVEQVVAFGNLLHVSGRDRRALEETLRRVVSEPHRYEPVASSLEDVFIGLMSGARDNFDAPAPTDGPSARA